MSMPYVGHGVRRLLLAGVSLCIIATAAIVSSVVLTSYAAVANNKMEQKDEIVKSELDWKRCLSPEEYRTLRRKHTERPFENEYFDNHEKGVYTCAGCGAELFSSNDKFDSGTGWPSFMDVVDSERVSEAPDRSHGMVRTEVLCSRCGGHLGHVFKDGPNPTGLRYCVNSAALDFKEQKNDPVATETKRTSLETATFGAGCFWCTEAAFESLDGVKSVAVGYMGGKLRDPTYKQVCSGRTGHAEVAQLEYDPRKISYDDILQVFWKVHDPTSLNRQGADSGTQYRSAIFYHSDEQRQAAERSKAKAQKKFRKRIVTEIVPAADFYVAENYHQDYYQNNRNAPYCRMIIAPKLRKLKR